MSEFSECLEAMRNHYKAGISAGKLSPFVPADRFSHFFSNDAKTLGSDAEQVVGGLQDRAQSLAQEEASKAEDGISKSTQTLKDNNVSAEAQKSFREKMEEERQKTKDRAVENIDKIYDEAIKVGEDNPQYQNAILATMQLASELFDNVWNSVKDFVVNIVNRITEWVKTAWESIKSTFEGITSTISGWFSFNAGRLQPN